MTRPFILVVAASLVVVFAGCMAEPVDDTDDESPALPVFTGPVFGDGTPAPVQHVLRDCYESIGSFAVPAGEYVDRTPDGFRVAPYTAVGTVPLASNNRAGGLTAPPDPTAFTGEVVAVASACHDASDAVVNRLLVFLMVEPPFDLRNEAATFGHLLLFAYFTDSQAHAEVLDAWGFSHVVRVGPMTANVDDDPGIRASQTEGSAGSIMARLETVVSGEPTQMEGSAARFFAAGANGTLAGIADASFGGFDALLGRATLTGSADAGIWQSGADHDGLGLQVWGHTNTWDHVPLGAPDDAADTDTVDP